MPVGGNFTALGGLAEGLAGRVLDAQRHERDQQDKARDLALQGILDSFKQGTVQDPNYAISYLMDLAKGKTPGKQGPSPLHPHIERAIGAIQQAQGQIGATGQGQGADQGQQGQVSGVSAPIPLQYPLDQGQQGGVPRILTPDEQFQRQFGYERAKSQADLQNKLDAVDYIKQRFPGISDPLARRMAGFTFPGMTQNIPGSVKGTDILADDPNAIDASGTPIRQESFYRARTEDGVLVYHPSVAPVGLTDVDLQRRVSDYVSKGFSQPEAEQMAHADRASERDTKAKAAAQRLTLNDLLERERADAIAGKLSLQSAMSIATRIGANDPTMSREDVLALGQEIFRRSALRQLAPQLTGQGGTTAPAGDTGAGAGGAVGAGGAGSAGGAKAPARTRGADLLSGRFATAKLTPSQKDVINFGDQVLKLVPEITGPIAEAGLQDAMGITAGGKQQLASVLYRYGYTTDEWNARINQYAGAIRAYAMRPLLGGRGNIPLQNLIGAHIPDPATDAPGLIFRKANELAHIVKTSAQTVINNAQMSPEQLYDQIQKDYEATGTINAKAQAASREAARRLRARQVLLDAYYQGKIRGPVDEATIDTFLKNNPKFP